MLNTLNLREASILIPKLMLTRIPIILIGSPGLGKSAITHTAADHFNLKEVDLRATTLEPSDFLGLPSVVNGKTIFNPISEFPLEGDEYPINLLTGEQYSGWLINLEELLDAKLSVQSACHKLILDRMVNQKRLHKDCYIIASSNKATDNASAGLASTALQSRFIWLPIESDFNQWVEDFAIPKGISEVIISYLEFNNEHFNSFNPDHTDYTYACSRTWSMLDRVIKQAFNNDIIDNPLFAKAVYGTIGPVAIDFNTFLNCYKDLPTIEQIITDPTNAPVPKELGSLYALKGMIMSRLDDTNVSQIGEYLYKSVSNREMVYLYYRSIREKLNTLGLNVLDFKYLKLMFKEFTLAASTTN